MTNFFDDVITLYNDIPSNAVQNRSFDRKVIRNCSIQGGKISKADGTVVNVINAKTVITKSVENYLSPYEYLSLPIDIRQDYYTVQVNDFIVFGEVDDIVENATQWAQLKKKYNNNGIEVASVDVNIYGLSVDNITIVNV